MAKTFVMGKKERYKIEKKGKGKREEGEGPLSVSKKSSVAKPMFVLHLHCIERKGRGKGRICKGHSDSRSKKRGGE